MRPASFALGLMTAVLLLHGCAASMPTPYGPIGDKQPLGYKDHDNPDGGHTLLVVVGVGDPHAYWDRRAIELCPAGIDHTNVFRADHGSTTINNYSMYGPTVGQRVWGAYQLEGYVYCKPEPKPAS